MFEYRIYHNKNRGDWMLLQYYNGDFCGAVICKSVEECYAAHKDMIDRGYRVGEIVEIEEE